MLPPTQAHQSKETTEQGHSHQQRSREVCNRVTSVKNEYYSLGRQKGSDGGGGVTPPSPAYPFSPPGNAPN